MADLGDPISRGKATKTLMRPQSTGAVDEGHQQRVVDHTVSHRRGLIQKDYPKDCPPLIVQWYFAVDIPKRKPNPAGGQSQKTVAGPPKKYAAFSNKDSRAIETAFQMFATENEISDRNRSSDRGKASDSDDGDLTQKAPNSPKWSRSTRSVKVPVNEDFLFDVDIAERELAPAYWLGPVYDVRRGTWFQADGLPCDENLATQLEEGYVRLAPWRFPQIKTAGRSRPRSALGLSNVKDASQSTLSEEESQQSLRTEEKSTDELKNDTVPESDKTNTHRLFGPYSKSVVTYQDAIVAWMTADDFISRMSGSMYQRFAGGSHLSGIRFTRGHVDASKKTEAKTAKTEPTATDTKTDDTSTSRPSPQPQNQDQQVLEGDASEDHPESKGETLARHMSSLAKLSSADDVEEHEEELRKRDEKEIRDDYANRENEEQNREIEHLLLVTHGIGQRLGLRLETVNFIHDVNTLRKTLKSVYDQSTDLQALNSEIDSLPKNCRIQVLPINWRHRLDFPKQSLKHNRGEHDLGDSSFGEEEDYPSLDDITVDGVPAVRNLITDLALDILLYDSPAYKDHIARIVVEECNRIYQLFRRREPNFKGKISFLGHSLGSALMFDILCRQPTEKDSRGLSKHEQQFKLDFDVEHFYAIGSPIGLFQMLKGRTIAARKAQKERTSMPDENAPSEGLFSSPKCAQIYNIFHPADPISYRLEPLISPAMKALRPQLLPYTKRGLFSAPGQGLSNIGNRVGQSVSGLWSSFSTGLASSLLNRSLDLSTDDEMKLRGSSVGNSSTRSLSLGAGTNIAAGTIDGGLIKPVGDDRKQKATRAAAMTTGEGEHPPTLLDDDIETLYSGFQQHQKASQEEDMESGMGQQEAEERAKKLKREEAKVRALNANSRVDYSIQEGAFDISLIAAVASHLSYWSDEDCVHFMISQLLSRQRIIKPSAFQET